MAETTYSYSISADFPGGLVNTTNLKSEIQATSSITISLNRIDTSGNTINIVFNAELSTGEKTILDGDITGPCGGLIAAHNSTQLIPIGEVIVKDEVGGARAKFDGHYLSAAQNEKKYSDYVMKQNLHMQGAYIHYLNMELGDCGQLSVVHPASITAPQSSMASSDTVLAVATGKGVYFNPLVVGDEATVEFYDNSNNFKFTRKVSSVSGDNVTLSSGVPEAVATNWTVRSAIINFHVDDGGFCLLGNGEFQYFQDKAITELMSTGLIFSLRLITNNTDAATRKLSMNYIFRKESAS